MPRVVLDMMDRRPVWAMPSWVPDEIRDRLPSDWELVVVDEPSATIYGGSAAAPVFADLAKFALSRFRIPPAAAPRTTAGTVSGTEPAPILD